MPVNMEEYYKIFNHFINVDILEANPELSKATISDVNIRTIKEEKKVAISFKENTKEFVLNKTNKNTLTNTFGDNPTTWVGKSIKLQIADVEFNGDIIKGIRIAIPEAIPVKKEEPKKEEPKVEKDEQNKVEGTTKLIQQVRDMMLSFGNITDTNKISFVNLCWSKLSGHKAEEIESIVDYILKENKANKTREEVNNTEKKTEEEETVIDSMINELAKTGVCAICKKPKGDKEAGLTDDATGFVHIDCVNRQNKDDQNAEQYIEPVLDGAQQTTKKDASVRLTNAAYLPLPISDYIYIKVVHHPLIIDEDIYLLCRTLNIVTKKIDEKDYKVRIIAPLRY